MMIVVKRQGVRHRKAIRNAEEEESRLERGRKRLYKRIDSVDLKCPISFLCRQHGSNPVMAGFVTLKCLYLTVNHQLLIKPAGQPFLKPECSLRVGCVCARVGWKAARWGSGQRGVVRSAKYAWRERVPAFHSLTTLL